MTDAPAQPKRCLPRFSLLSLILFVLLCTTGYGLWARWEPWVKSFQIDSDGILIKYTDDGKYVAVFGGNHLPFFIDSRTGAIQENWPPSGESFSWTEPFDEHHTLWSSDGVRAIGVTMPKHVVHIYEGRSRRRLWSIASNGEEINGVMYSPVEDEIVFQSAETISSYRRRRPEYWWGVAWLPEFWLTVALGVGLLWSSWRDRKMILNPELEEKTGK